MNIEEIKEDLILAGLDIKEYNHISVNENGWISIKGFGASKEIIDRIDSVFDIIDWKTEYDSHMEISYLHILVKEMIA